MDTGSTVSLIAVILIGIFLFRILTRIFLKIILVLIIVAVIAWLLISQGAVTF